LSDQLHLAEIFSTDNLRIDLKGRSVRGGLLTLSSQAAQFFLQSIATVVLARLLVPGDFGLVAMATSITGLGQAFADLGLSEATIQREGITHEQVSTLFWINTVIGFTLTLLTIGLAPVLAWFYGEPRLKAITLVLSATFLIGGLRVQHDALLRRQMRFRALGIRDVAACLFAVPVGIVLAWNGAGYWSLLALPLTLNFTQMVLSWVMARWIPGLPQRNAEVGSLLGFGGKVAISYLTCNVTRSADSVLIGWYWGATPLGLYSRAYNLLMLPVRQLSGPVRSVAVPGLSRTQDNPALFARYYLRAVNLILWISTPIFGFLFVAAEPVITLVLGNRWLAAAPIFQLLSIAALGHLLLESVIWIFISSGESGRLFRLVLSISTVIIFALAAGLPFGIKMVALFGSVTLVAIFPWILRYTFRGTHINLLNLGRAILCPVSLSLSAVSISELALHVIVPRVPGSRLMTVAVIFCLVYALSVLIRPVRHEIASFWKLTSKLGHSEQIG
jgi:PST family polysaccharide transporter